MEASDLTARRIAENQSAFRAANERIEAAAVAMEFEDETIPLICECPDPSCTDLVRLTVAAYEDVRAHPQRFLCAPGHQAIALGAGVAVVVEEHPGHVVVDKIGVAGEVAEALYNAHAQPG